MDTKMKAQKEKDELLSRRDFLSGLKKWSKVVIAGAVATAVTATTGSKAHAGWINRRGGHRGGGWINRRGGGGSWINRH
ncbi:hypothetical protein N9934_03045 [Desulfosarcina sp.]|nr:hypothetical protein [Desulfosarcina sp.]